MIHLENRTFLTKSGVSIFYDWRDAVGVDCDLPAIRKKADPTICGGKDRFVRGNAKGYSRICSLHSEDRLTWIFFRSLERSGHAAEFLGWCFPSWPDLRSQVTREFLYWGRRARESTIDASVDAALALLEPDQRARRTQHTETDAAIPMATARVMIEAKLRSAPDRTGWEKSGDDPIRTQYEIHATALLRDSHKAEWRKIVRQFYQPMRNLMLGSILEDRDLSRVGLLLIVNAKQGTEKRTFYKRKFAELKDALILPASQLSLRSWHDLVPWANQFGQDLELAIEKLETNPLLASSGATAVRNSDK